MHKPILLGALLALGLALPAAVTAGELYRYVDDRGVTVLSRQGVPPEFIGNGYEVLNDQGRVIQVVPPAPSPEERQRLAAEKARAGSDKQLLRLYSSPEDVDRARARKMAELDGMIGIVRGNLQSARTQQANLESLAADHERAGRAVPEHLLAQIENQKVERQRLKAEIARYEEIRKRAQASFEADRRRVSELLGRRGSD